tara:strand:- start:352 stop:891 length:540 start_codon:yes stop_codon:yes gene_type:complete
MNNNVTKPKTYEGYKVVDKKAIITNSQMNMMSKQFDRFKKALNYDSLEPFVIDSINDVLETHNVQITSYQVGADKTGSDSDLMIEFKKRISELHMEFVRENKNEIFSINGKYFWLDKKQKLREFSETFTARTPEGFTAKEYQKTLLEKAVKLGLNLNNEVKEVVETETENVDSEVINEI